MACSTISKRIIFHSLIFIPSLFISSFLSADTGIELELQYDKKGLSATLSGIYATDYVVGKIGVHHKTPFPDNIVIKFEPVISRSSNQTILTSLLAGFTDGYLNLGKYYLKKIYYHDEELENHLKNSYLQKRKKNLQLLNEAY
jgi:hypothetical protein